MRHLSLLILLTTAIFESACLMGPNYKRPQVAAPPTYRGADGVQIGAAAEKSLGDERWWTVFQDEELQKLIRMALQQNFDLRLAANRVEQARQQVIVVRSNQFPTVNGVAQDTGLKTPQLGGGFPTFTYNAIELGFSGNWDIDFWGKYRRATEAARASLLATEWAQKAVISSLVANVATAYFGLRELDLQLDISRRTLESRQQSLSLTKTLVDGGASPLTDQRQAEQLVEVAAAAIPDLERQVQQEENAISILLGENPGPVTRGRSLVDQPLPNVIPAGLPSALLERRPDIREAEQYLMAANAEIGVARASYFPDISLTGLAGVQSGSLGSLFATSAGAWSYTASVTQPIFNAGRLRANVRIAEAQQQQALLQYQQAIQSAFRDVSNALIAYQKFRMVGEHQAALAAAAKDASDLSHMRYQGGSTSYLEVLTNETNYYSAELSLATAQLNERLALVQLYGSLGGGWQEQ